MRSYINLQYHHSVVPDNKHCLDLYIPEISSSSSPVPVLLYTHGGCWVNRDKGDYAALCEKMATTFNVVVAIINYQLATADNDIRYPSCTRDFAAGIVWLYDHAAEYGLDDSKFLLGGHSAGANMSMMVHQNPNLRGYSEHDLNCPVWGKIRGVCGISGIYDVPLMHSYLDDKWPQYNDLPLAFYPKGEATSEEDKVTKYQEGSVTSYTNLAVKDVSYLVMHSTDDVHVNVPQVEALRQHLAAFMTDVHYDVTAFGTHFELLDGDHLLTTMKGWIQKVLI